MATPEKIISGGQTGADQAALRAAQDAGLPCGGWCPPGRRCESGMIPSQFPLQETPDDCSPEAPGVPHSQRTQWNVQDSDATLILRPISCETSDPGTDWTIRCVARYGWPLLVCDPADPLAAEKIKEWLGTHQVRTLNVAGPSEKTAPGIGGQVHSLLVRVLVGEGRNR
jgi:hypothetical protein